MALRVVGKLIVLKNRAKEDSSMETYRENETVHHSAQPSEDEFTKAVEKYTALIPSSAYLAIAIGATFLQDQQRAIEVELNLAGADLDPGSSPLSCSSGANNIGPSPAAPYRAGCGNILASSILHSGQRCLSSSALRNPV
jgi:hypothetical protein